jgi:hypothetical protein
MKLEEERFKLILAGTATNLSSREILIRHVAYLAERRGEDPMLAVEAEMPDVTIVRAKDKARAILTKAEQTLSPRIVAARQTTSSVLATEKITPGKNQSPQHGQNN